MEVISENKKYNVLEMYLNKLIKEEISLDENLQTKYNRYLDEVLNKNVLPAMRSIDQLFDCLFKRFRYAGSFYENLKVGKPNEFDLNLEFKIPASQFEITDNRVPGYVEVQIKSFDEKEMKRCFQKFPDGEVKLKKAWLDDELFLNRNKVSAWMHGVMARSMEVLRKTCPLKITSCQSGPAMTLKISHVEFKEDPEPVEFSVDLVPVFVFTAKDWPPSMRSPNMETNVESQKWCIVPKPPLNRIDPTFWRPSFYGQEKILMNNKHNMKKALKLMKLLRDKLMWVNLSSYYIKTIFLWETTHLEDNFWSEASGSIVFIHMLRRLMTYLENHKIPFFWNENVNLVEARNKQELVNIRNRIDKLLKKLDNKLESFPGFILTFFGWSEERIRDVISSPTSPIISIGGSSPRSEPERTTPPRLVRYVGVQRNSPSDNAGSSNDCDTTDSSNTSVGPTGNKSQRHQEDEDDPIDWNTMQSIMKVGAYAGALIAGGAFLIIRNAQRQERRRQSARNSNNTST